MSSRRRVFQMRIFKDYGKSLMKWIWWGLSFCVLLIKLILRLKVHSMTQKYSYTYECVLTRGSGEITP